jgi:hypothetical protein
MRFDAERNWAFLAALLAERSIELRDVFTDPALQRNVDPHADHLHIRLRCPPAHRRAGCADR